MNVFVRMAPLVVAVACLQTSTTMGQAPGVHYLNHGQMPPGVIGHGRLQRGGPVEGYFQPIEIRAPAGVMISTAVDHSFGPARPAPLTVGLLVGKVYRLRITGIPRHPGSELFPTVEVIDRLYPPAGMERKFPIVVELIEDDLEQALNGRFVTRVVYLEDPRTAPPVRSDGRPQNWFDVGPGKDPLLTADLLGRPVAVVRLGARVPGDVGREDDRFFYGCPPVAEFPPTVKVLPPPPEQGRPAADLAPEAPSPNQTPLQSAPKASSSSIVPQETSEMFRAGQPTTSQGSSTRSSVGKAAQVGSNLVPNRSEGLIPTTLPALERRYRTPAPPTPANRSLDYGMPNARAAVRPELGAKTADRAIGLDEVLPPSGAAETVGRAIDSTAMQR